MTRTEAELKIFDKVKEIKKILLEYNPNADYLSVGLVKHTDPDDDLFVPDTWSINIHTIDKKCPLSIYVSDGEIFQHDSKDVFGKVIAENVEI